MFYVYILTCDTNSVLYVGMTNDLKRRIYEHVTEMHEGFTKRYHLHKLVYFEEYPSAYEAIKREKQIKGWKRERKLALVETQNKDWRDYTPHVLKSGL